MEICRNHCTLNEAAERFWDLGVDILGRFAVFQQADGMY